MADMKTYDLQGRSYSGVWGSNEVTVTPDTNGRITTDDPDVQGFLENVWYFTSGQPDESVATTVEFDSPTSASLVPSVDELATMAVQRGQVPPRQTPTVDEIQPTAEAPAKGGKK